MLITNYYFLFISSILLLWQSSSVLTTLSYPNSLLTGRNVCNAIDFSISPTFTVIYSSPIFTVNPMLTYGIAGITMTFSSATDYLKFDVTTQSETLGGFDYLVWNAGAYLFSSISLIYLAVQIGAVQYGIPLYQPFYFQQVGGGSAFKDIHTITSIDPETKQYTASWGPFPTGPNPKHLLKCVTLISGLNIYYSNLNIEVSSQCKYDGDGGYFHTKIVTKKSMFVNEMKLSLILIDIFPLQNYFNLNVQTYSIKYVNGITSDVLALYVMANTAVFYGFSKISFSGNFVFIFDMDYISTPVPPLVGQSTFQYIFLSTMGCPASTNGFIPIYTCFAGYNGCPMTTNQLVTLPSVTSRILVSHSHEYIAFCTFPLIQVYKHDGVSYVPYKTISPSLGGNCIALQANDDLSILAVMSTVTGMEVFVFNTTSTQYQVFSTYGNINTTYDQIQIDMTEAGDKILLKTRNYANQSTLSGVDVIVQDKVTEYLLRINYTTLNYYLINTTNQQYSVIAQSNSIIYSAPINSSAPLQIIMYSLVDFSVICNYSFLTWVDSESIVTWVVNKEGDGKTLAIWIHTYGVQEVIVYHYLDQLNTWQYQHKFRIRGLWVKQNRIMSKMKMGQAGKTLAIYSKDLQEGYLLIYKRVGLTQFKLVEMQRTNQVTTDRMALQQTVKFIAINYGTGSQIQIFYCGASIVTYGSISNGRDQIIQSQPLIPNITLNTTTFNTTNLINTPQTTQKQISPIQIALLTLVLFLILALGIILCCICCICPRRKDTNMVQNKMKENVKQQNQVKLQQNKILRLQYMFKTEQSHLNLNISPSNLFKQLQLPRRAHRDKLTKKQTRLLNQLSKSQQNSTKNEEDFQSILQFQK